MGKAAGLIASFLTAGFVCLAASVHGEPRGCDTIPLLPTVKLHARGAGVRVRNDTVEYLASAYTAPDVHKVQDLLGRLEGFSVSPDGRVHFNGQEIETILINGEDMTGKNYRLLSSYLRAGLVKKVQLIRDYDPDPLLRSVKRSGKIGLSLVMYDSLSHSLSGGADIGATVGGKKDMDLHLLSLQGPRKAIALGKWNGTGETVTGNRDFYARDENERQVPSGQERSTPVHIGTIFPPSLPVAYVRSNDDATGSLIVKQKLGQGKQLGFVFGVDHFQVDREQQRSSHYALPDGSSWSMTERERTRESASNLFLRSEYTNDRGWKGRAHISLDVFGLGSNGSFLDDITGAVTGHLKEWDKLRTARFNGHLRNSWKTRSGVLLLEGSLSDDHERQFFTVKDTADILQVWRCRELRQDMLISYTAAKRRHTGSWGIRYQGKDGSRVAEWILADAHVGQVGYSSRSLNLAGEWEHRTGRNARLQFEGSAGVGSWRVGLVQDRRFTILHDLTMSYLRQMSPFTGWSLAYRDLSSLPDESYVLPMHLVTGRYTVIEPQKGWRAPSLHQVSINFHTRNLVAGAGMMFMLGYSLHENDLLPALDRVPGRTRIIPMVSRRSDDLHASLGGDLHVEPLRLKWSGDLHLTGKWGKALVNQVWTDRTMRNVGMGSRLVTLWKGPVNVEASLNLDNNRYSDNTIKESHAFATSSSQMKIRLRAHWREHWYMAVSLERYSMPGLPSFLAADAFLSWQCHERLQFSLTGHNLLGQKRSMTHWVDAGSDGETVYKVVPMYLLWKMSWALG